MVIPTAEHDLLLKKIGDNIRRHRKARGWTQEQLAERAALSTYFVGSVERGQATLSLRSLHQIAATLRIPLSVLVQGDEQAERALVLRELLARLENASTEQLRVLLDVTSIMLPGRKT